MRLYVLSLLLFLCSVGCGRYAPSRAAWVATGLTSHQLCSAVFISGLPADAFFDEAIAPSLSIGRWLVSYDIDRKAKRVSARMLGVETHAVYRGKAGCALDDGTHLEAFVRPGRPSPESDVVPPESPALVKALNRAFEETTSAPYRRTKAIVVVHDGQIVAERYAKGVGPDTPLLGWSATKSITNALAGILVQQRKLSMDVPTGIAAWQGKDDPRRAITPNHLMRMTSGLDLGDSLNPSLLSMFDRSAQMLFCAPDMAAFAAKAKLIGTPGAHFAYADASTILLSSVIRDRVGGTPQAMTSFVQRELFAPLGMEHATLELDSAGTPLGSTHMLASARDWARFGFLYLNDGVLSGQHVLPEGWVESSAAYTPQSGEVGYGAGFWTQRGASRGAKRRIALGMPADSFMARGAQGQYVVIVPSQKLVIVRMGHSFTPLGDLENVGRLVGDVIAAVAKS